MDTQLVYPFRLRQRNFERRQRLLKNIQGVAIRKHRGIGQLTTNWRKIERKEKHQATQLEQLTKKQIFLKWRCEQLISYNEALCKRRSVSECSTSTISSTNSYELTRSSSSICESDEIDVIGFSSNQSDSDDHLSVQSLKSGGSVDSGVVLKSTSRLTLSSTENAHPIKFIRASLKKDEDKNCLKRFEMMKKKTKKKVKKLSLCSINQRGEIKIKMRYQTNSFFLFLFLFLFCKSSDDEKKRIELDTTFQFLTLAYFLFGLETLIQLTAEKTTEGSF
ncbi:CLUMA_CG001338, isoform A [Clunio marinus]|uniref:CLUMA_CG001338, isoform A n=1 Tax=Clunio marinus TaxID=568069 RepID=A0A1J1HJF4_9DIPT|nr:CLUMA_CG001338, isoform A [Clunio marinus]